MERLGHTDRPRRIIAAVTNDLSHDQRMIRICATLQTAGYAVELVGRLKKESALLPVRAFRQTRLPCFFQRGILFYAEYNLRLWWYLLRRRFDAVCAVDTDTLPACFFAAGAKGKPCVLDAHEYFSEVPELALRPFVKKIWEIIAALLIPRLRHCYTVGDMLAEALSARYGVPFGVIRNLPLRRDGTVSDSRPGVPFIVLYQGILNEGRGLEEMIGAMEQLEGVQLWLVGHGDLSEALRRQATHLAQAGKVIFYGFMPPEQLWAFTAKADIGINLLADRGLSYRYSLANKAFDYIQAGLPSIQMDFPEYRRLNEQFGVFACIEALTENAIAEAVARLRDDRAYYNTLRHNCIQAAAVLHWEAEAPKLLSVYEEVFKKRAARR